MPVLFTIWFVLLAGVTLIWASRHRAVSRASREEIPLASDAYADPPAPAPFISVMVAAKDEQDNIRECVTSMLSQSYPRFEVIAVNDRSRDATPQILDELASRNDRLLQVHHVTELREGWFGKNNAMRLAVEHARGDWLCFIDADCRQISRETLTVAIRYALEHDIDFLSVLPILESKSFWERVIQPVCSAIMVMWFRPAKVNNPQSSAAYANGAFMLMKRELYQAIGGHERIRTEVNEDMHMARLTKQAGRRLFVIQNKDLYVTRMYAGLKQAWYGWSRIFYGCFGSYRRLAISAAVLFLASMMPFLSLLAGIAGWMVAEPGDAAYCKLLTALAALTVIVQHSLLYRYYRLCRADMRFLPTYVLGAFIAFGMLMHALLKQSGRVSTTWRGTTYRGASLEPTSTRTE